MSRNSPSSAAPVVPDWRTVLGLVELKEFDWGRVRAAQVNVARRLAPVRLVISLLAVAVIIAMLRGHAPAMLLYGWGVVSATVAVLMAHSQLRNRKWQIQTATQSELHRETLWSTFIAISFGAAPLLFSRYCNAADLLLMWAVCTTLVTATAFGLSALPLATGFYILIMTVCLALGLWSIGLTLVAYVAAMFGTLLMLACLGAGRTFIINAS